MGEPDETPRNLSPPIPKSFTIFLDRQALTKRWMYTVLQSGNAKRPSVCPGKQLWYTDADDARMNNDAWPTARQMNPDLWVEPRGQCISLSFQETGVWPKLLLKPTKRAGDRKETGRKRTNLSRVRAQEGTEDKEAESQPKTGQRPRSRSRSLIPHLSQKPPGVLRAWPKAPRTGSAQCFHSLQQSNQWSLTSGSVHKPWATPASGRRGRGDVFTGGWGDPITRDSSSIRVKMEFNLHPLRLLREVSGRGNRPLKPWPRLGPPTATRAPAQCVLAPPRTPLRHCHGFLTKTDFARRKEGGPAGSTREGWLLPDGPPS